MFLKEYVFLDTFSKKKKKKNVYVCYEPVVVKELFDLFWDLIFMRSGAVGSP